MRKCILHIGMHKTGSTSIQQSLFQFANDEFYYPDLDGMPNHIGPLRAAFVEGSGMPLEPHLAQLGDRTLILSAEGLTQFPAEAVKRLRDFLAKHFSVISVIGYVRAPASLMTSQFIARQKSRPTGEFRIERLYPHYRRLFEKFDDIFGKNNVDLSVFDPRQFPQGCIVRKFCTQIGMHLPEEKIVRSNESIPYEAVSLLYIHRKFGTRLGSHEISARQRGMLVSKLRSIGHHKLTLSAGLTDPILDINRDDIAWAEARIGASLAEKSKPDAGGCIRSERDLLNPDKSTLDALLQLTGSNAPAEGSEIGPVEIARLVHSLVPAGEASSAAGRSDAVKRIVIDAAGITSSLLRENGSHYGVMLASGAPKLTQYALEEIADLLKTSESPSLYIEGLGEFRRIQRRDDAAVERNDAARAFLFRPQHEISDKKGKINDE